MQTCCAGLWRAPARFPRVFCRSHWSCSNNDRAQYRMLRNKMAEFPNSLFTQSVARSHRDKEKSHKKKAHKPHHTSSQSWNVSSSSFSSTMPWRSSCTSDDSEQNIRSKLKKIKKEGSNVELLR